MDREIDGVCDKDGARFSPQPTKNKCCCYVNGCRSKACRDVTVRFHSFPKAGVDFVNIVDINGVNMKMCRRDAWAQILKMDRQITENARVCSLHFKRSDYILPDAPTQRRHLKKDAVPSCNLPEASSDETPDEKIFIKNESYEYVQIKTEALEYETKFEMADLEAIIDRDHSYTMSPFADERRLAPNDRLTIKEEPPESEMNFENQQTIECTRTAAVNASIKEEYEEPEIKFECVDLPDIDINDHYQQICESSMNIGNRGIAKTYNNKTTQTDENASQSKFIDILQTDENLNIMTGIRNFKILESIIDIVKNANPRMAQAAGLKLSIKERIIMTMMKLKQAMSYGILATFFECTSKKSCKKIVLRTLDIMSEALKFSIHWNHEEDDIIDDFREFTNIRCIVNRIEIAVRKSKNLSCRVAERSLHKHYYSMKLVTAVTPGGSICFVSKPQGGSTPHRDVFEASNIIEFLKKNQSIVVLKDFPIDDICRDNGINIVRSLPSSHGALTGQNRERLNVNRSIRRFRIFRFNLMRSLALRIDRIVTIICAIENFHKSLPDVTETNML